MFFNVFSDRFDCFDCQPHILAGEVDVKLTLLFWVFWFSRIFLGFLLVLYSMFCGNHGFAKDIHIPLESLWVSIRNSLHNDVDEEAHIIL